MSIPNTGSHIHTRLTNRHTHKQIKREKIDTNRQRGMKRGKKSHNRERKHKENPIEGIG